MRVGAIRPFSSLSPMVSSLGAIMGRRRGITRLVTVIRLTVDLRREAGKRCQRLSQPQHVLVGQRETNGEERGVSPRATVRGDKGDKICRRERQLEPGDRNDMVRDLRTEWRKLEENLEGMNRSLNDWKRKERVKNAKAEIGPARPVWPSGDDFGVF